MVEPSAAVEGHNGDEEVARLVVQASFQVLSGRGGKDVSRWVAALEPHTVGDDIQVDLIENSDRAHEGYLMAEEVDSVVVEIRQAIL